MNEQFPSVLLERAVSEFAKLRQENGFNDEAPCLNMVFMGQPGTGKHSVAELTGKIFAELGVLRDGRVRRYRREDLSVPGYAAESQLYRTEGR